MPIRPESKPSAPTLEFLKRCYKFVNREWPHLEREPVPDSGFEQRFRESCIQHLQGWSISEERELHLGAGLDTASGVPHEVDVIARHLNLTAILEIKNRGYGGGSGPGKNDVITFFAKILDYLAANPSLVSGEVCLVFMSRGPFEPRGLAACLGLGIHPVASDMHPMPILVNNAMIMENELRKGLTLSPDALGRFDDWCAKLNKLYSALRETWLDNRCGYLSEDRILLRAVAPLNVDALAQDLSQVNSDWSNIYDDFKDAKGA